jgi:hypothetical protein
MVGHGGPEAPRSSWVYVLCLGEPRTMRDADVPPHIPVTHYVGYTQQQPPMNRPMSHGRGLATRVVLLVPGTLQDENDLKTGGTCPLCGQPLNYFLDAYQRLRRTLAPADAAYLLLAGGAEPGARAGAELRRRWTELRQQAEKRAARERARPRTSTPQD